MILLRGGLHYFILLAVVLSLTSCATYKALTKVEGKTFDETQHKTIIVGLTTDDDILARFGPPLTDIKINQREKEWAYEYTLKKPLLDEYENQRLIILFKNNIAVDKKMWTTTTKVKTVTTILPAKQ